MWSLEEIIAKLRAPRRDALVPEREPAAADLLRRTVRAGAVELPILNLAGLWALRALAAADGNDAEELIKVLWVLRHQNDDRILAVADAPPSAAELAAVGRDVDLGSLADYVAALEAMLALVSKKKTAAAPPTKASPLSAC
jgi:hypothetical protein